MPRFDQLYFVHSWRFALQMLFGIMVIIALPGCYVPLDNPYGGKRLALTEPQTHRKFYLYLPAGYDVNKRWPVVVTLHGMRPFDISRWQLREWRNVADKYGLIVVAPDITSSDVVTGFRIEKVTPAVQEDVKAVLNSLDYVLDHYAADRQRVLMTSWSAGGYLMHYIANQYPERFAALCARGASFNSAILDEEKARNMGRNHFPVLIFYGQSDFVHIIMESNEALAWYRKMGFDPETFIIPQVETPPIFGHDRRPEEAAKFFLRVTNLSNELRIIASTEAGTAPLLVNFSAQLPHQIEAEGLNYLWTLDGEPVARTAEAYANISTPGVHKVQVLVTDRTGKTLTATRQITIQPGGT